MPREQKQISPLQKGGRWLIEALFPSRCVVCGSSGSFLCDTHQAFPPAPPSEAVFVFLEQCHAHAAYADPVVKRCVEFFKFRGFASLAEIFGEKMAAEVPAELRGKDVLLVPIPLHWTRRFWRGFNQANLLAREIKKHHPTFTVSKGLRRPKRTRQQARLSKAERAQNLQNAFVWRGESLQGKHVLLVDDVVASGATLDAAARVLKDAGATAVQAVVFARGGKKPNPGSRTRVEI
ncbi:MAG: ComF family protein [Candidatus Gracilibacteria bacterium]|nr:ComF family protein [Candidatus Gracilibacteria bacterium]